MCFENNAFSASNLTTSKLLMKSPSGELHKRTEIIRSLTKKVKTLESNHIECQSTLQKTQLQLQEMAQKATHSTLLSEDLEVGFKISFPSPNSVCVSVIEKLD